MKKRLALAAVTALLAACSPQPSPPVEPPPVTPVTPPTPGTPLSDVTLHLGKQISGEVNQSFTGSWSVTGVPQWLSLSAVRGTGPLHFTVTANRNAATPLRADQPWLSAVIKVNWTTSDGKQGVSQVLIDAEQYTLLGQVSGGTSQSLNVVGNDVEVSAQTGAASTEEARRSRGVLVQYRSAALRDLVIEAASASEISAQSVSESQQVAAQASRTLLENLRIPAQARTAVTGAYARLDVPATPQLLAALRSDPNVLSAVPNVVLHEQAVTPVVPTDAYAPLQWAYPLMGYGAVWRDMQGGAYTRAVTVAVADSGVRYDHPDLSGKLFTSTEGALDLVTGTARGDNDDVDTDPTDPPGPSKSGSHGTHVTGIIVAKWGENGATCAGCSSTGVVGASYLAPVKVLPIRIIDTSGDTDPATVAQAITYAAGLPLTIKDASGKSVTYTNPNPAQVINLSLGGPSTAAEAEVMCSAAKTARDRGILVVAAGGNAGTETPYYPAACPAVVAVGSVTLGAGRTPVRADYSNTYNQIMLSAPGGVGPALTFYNGGTLNGTAFPDGIFSTGWDYTRNQPNYQRQSGTSQAAPQVSALAALLLSKGVTQSASDTLQRMIETATDLGTAGRDPEYGYGMINAAAALGASAVASGLGLRIQDDQGRTFEPLLDSAGNFRAYLGNATYTVTAGRDSNGNGVVGEKAEPTDQATVTLGPDKPTASVTLAPK